MSWRLIDSDAALTEALASLPAQQAVAVDTEFMRRNTYYPQVALLQLYAGGDALLVDPLAVRDLDGLRELMLDETRPKVLHSCSECEDNFSAGKRSSKPRRTGPGMCEAMEGAAGAPGARAWHGCRFLAF